MPTKFYFHDATTTVGGTLPGSSMVLGTATVTASGASTNRSMDDTIGSSQVSQALTTNATTSQQTGWFRRFISPPLTAQTIASQTITVRLAASESNAASDMFEVAGFNLILWRPSTGSAPSASLFSGSGVALTEPGTTQTACTGSGTSISRTAADGDVLVLEIYSTQVQSMASNYTNTVFYDGTTEGSTTSNAAHVEFTNNVTLQTGPATHNLAGDITYSPALDGAVARDTFAAGDIALGLTVDGALARETKLSGDITFDPAVDGNIAIQAPAHALAGDITFDPALDGAIGRETSLTGDIALNPAVDGAIARDTFVTGDITYAPAVDGVIARTTFVAGDVDLPLAVDGNVVITGGATTHDLAGDIAFNPALDGAVARTTFAAGDVAFDPALDGVVRVGTSLAGDIAYTIAIDGALSRQTSLAGDIVLAFDVDGNVAFAATVVPATVRAADTHPRATVAIDLEPSEQAARDLSGVLVAARDLTP